MKVKEQIHEENYSIYNGDCMDVLPTIKDQSVDLVVYSPPFAGLYNYSSDHRDFSNCANKNFNTMTHVRFLPIPLLNIILLPYLP